MNTKNLLNWIVNEYEIYKQNKHSINVKKKTSISMACIEQYTFLVFIT